MNHLKWDKLLFEYVEIMGIPYVIFQMIPKT